MNRPMNPNAVLKRMQRLLMLLVGALLAWTNPASAKAEAVPLPEGDSFIQPFAETRYLLDLTGEMDLSEVLRAADRFQPVADRWIDFGEQQGRIWLRTRVTNDGARAARWMVDLQRQQIDDLEVWKIGEGAPQSLLSLNASSTLADRPVRSRYIVVPLDMEAGETADIVVSYASSTGTWLPLTFATPEAFRTAHMREERTNWALNGALAALVAIALALSRIAGWRLALSYCAYALAGGLLLANIEGYLFRFVWPENAAIYERANIALIAAFIAAGLSFSREFTEFSERRPRLDRVVRGLVWLLVATIPLAMFLPDPGVMLAAVHLAVPLGAATYVGMAADAVRARVLGAVPFAIGAVALSLTLVFTALVLAFPGQYAVTVALDYIHVTILLEGLAFLIAMVLRILRIREELNRSLAAELEGAQERLRLSDELAQSQRRYDETKRLAETRRARLASASHDLQQPLVALRRSLAGAQDPDERDRASAALDYLEKLTSQGLAETRPDALVGEAPDEGKESFPISIIVANCRAMFQREAEAKGMTIEAIPAEDSVLADPVILMRITSNIVSNALKHSGGTRVTIAARPEAERLALEISDNGKGMSAAELADLRSAYRKGEESEGEGLGLHLVHSLCEEQDIELQIESVPGAGTSFLLGVRRGES